MSGIFLQACFLSAWAHFLTTLIKLGVNKLLFLLSNQNQITFLKKEKIYITKAQKRVEQNTEFGL